MMEKLRQDIGRKSGGETRLGGEEKEKKEEEEKEEEGPSHLRWTSARTRALLGHDLFPREGAADCHVASQRPSQASWG